MSTYFLAVRFPLALIGNAPPDRTAPTAPAHEQESHVFFLTDLRVLADRLGELFRQEKPDAAWQRAAYKQASKPGPDPLSPPIFEVVDGADHSPTECVRFQQEVRQLAGIAPSSYLDPDGWELLGFPNDPRTVLLVRHYEQARKWESLLREELRCVSRPRARRRASQRRNVKPEAAAPAVRERVWMWALRPLERDHTPNMCEFIDESPGCVVQMIHDAQTGAAIPLSLAPDGRPINRKPRLRTLAEMRDGKSADNGWCIWYRYYRPSADDLSILKAIYPGSEPGNPNWLNVKRDLVCCGHAPDSLAKMEAPVLLGLLARARGTTIAAGVPSVTMPESGKIFISYSHKDKKFLDELLIHLKPLVREGILSTWSDKQIEPGAKWLTEVKDALATSKIAVLLVTKDSLASDFIHEHELGPLLKAAEQGGVRVLWVLVRACNWAVGPVQRLQAVIPPDKPLAQMKAERDEAWVKICDEIKRAAASPRTAAD